MRIVPPWLKQTVLVAPAAASAESRKIVVVGPCAAGKSTLVAALRALGYDAHVSGQEHSEIATLWQHSQPDVLIALDGRH